MRIIVTMLALLCLAAAPDPLAGERWRHRLVLVFADSPDDPDVSRQQAFLADFAAGLAERDVRVLWVMVDSAPDGMDVQALRRRFAVTERFVTILVGKDGGEKLRAAKPLAAEKLFAVIDAMPMRRREARGTP